MKVDSLIFLHPGRRLAEQTHRLAQLFTRLTLAGRAQLRFYRQRMEGYMGKLQTLSPLAVLQRGYSIARLLPSKEVIRRASRLKAEDRVNVKVHRGEFIARVEDVKGNDEER